MPHWVVCPTALPVQLRTQGSPLSHGSTSLSTGAAAERSYGAAPWPTRFGHACSRCAIRRPHCARRPCARACASASWAQRHGWEALQSPRRALRVLRDSAAQVLVRTDVDGRVPVGFDVGGTWVPIGLNDVLRVSRYDKGTPRICAPAPRHDASNVDDG